MLTFCPLWSGFPPRRSANLVAFSSWPPAEPLELSQSLVLIRSRSWRAGYTMEGQCRGSRSLRNCLSGHSNTGQRGESQASARSGRYKQGVLMAEGAGAVLGSNDKPKGEIHDSTQTRDKRRWWRSLLGNDWIGY